MVAAEVAAEEEWVVPVGADPAEWVVIDRLWEEDRARLWEEDRARPWVGITDRRWADTAVLRCAIAAMATGRCPTVAVAVALCA